MKLSICLATYNEAENIRDFLLSVKDLADEIVIVDGGSQDDTVKLAKEFKAKVILADNPKIFHFNKQKAIDAASSEWILQLDADERMTTDLKKEIKSLISSDTKKNGFWTPRKNFFLGRFLTKGGQYPDYTLRLYRKGKGYLPCKSVHEQAIVEGETGYLKNPLIHIADPTFERYLLRFNRYTTLMAQEFHVQHLPPGFITLVNFFIVKPIIWFLTTFIRHKGFVDGFPGFVFSFFSSLRFPVAYIKYWELKYAHRH